MNEVKVLNGKEYVFIENNSEDVIVSFNSHNGYPNFFKLNSLKDNTVCNYVFLNNQNNWYLDDDEGESYQKLLKNLLKKYDPKNITFFGSSMGGYGALYHGLKLGVNIIASNPQIDKQVTLNHDIAEGTNYCNSLLKVDLIPIDRIVNEIDSVESAIYIISGNYLPDVENLKKLLSHLPNNIKYIIEKAPFKTHDYYIHDNSDLHYRHEILKKLRLSKTSYSENY